MTLRRTTVRRAPPIPASIPLVPEFNDEGYNILAVFDQSAGNATTTNQMNITGFQFATNSKLISIRATVGIQVTATLVPEDLGGRGVIELFSTGSPRPAIGFSPIATPSPTAQIGGYINGPTRNAWWNDGYYRGQVTWDINYGPHGVAITENGRLNLTFYLWTPVAVPAVDLISVQAEFVFKTQS